MTTRYITRVPIPWRGYIIPKGTEVYEVLNPYTRGLHSVPPIWFILDLSWCSNPIHHEDAALLGIPVDRYHVTTEAGTPMAQELRLDRDPFRQVTRARVGRKSRKQVTPCNAVKTHLPHS